MGVLPPVLNYEKILLIKTIIFREHYLPIILISDL